MMRRVVRVCVTAVGIAAVVAAVASGDGWRAQRLPLDVASNGGELYGVAFVGSDMHGLRRLRSRPRPDAGDPVKGSEVVSTASAGPPVVPGGAIETAGLACPSSEACVGVGSYDNAAYLTVPFAEMWDGGRWSLQELPYPTGAMSVELNGVSCMSRNACLAVGSATTPLGQNSVTATLAERWDGKQWTIQPTPNPPLGIEFNPFAGSELNGVSCASRNACTLSATRAASPFHWSRSGTVSAGRFRRRHG